RAGGTLYQERLLARERQEDRRLDALVGDVAGALEAVGDLFAREHHLKFPSTPRPLRVGAPAARRCEAPTSCLRLPSAAIDLRGAAALQKDPRAMLEPVALVARRRTHLFGVGRQLDA